MTTDPLGDARSSLRDAARTLMPVAHRGNPLGVAFPKGRRPHWPTTDN
ncbi:hypothetical protein [Anabaena subtropica]|uniref:Uncharacterized protein n=1 Tax=Anabaena subtropica FACHB-260 TaxID=2692884 RepID=A0ABR8CWB1_9NOST|nr:hypothetical protein [Anabaena subtropica]MBD2346668.1 hypothetical protein [Anabaena subtropica FACHB-260]